jgi:hypothetical protein
MILLGDEAQVEAIFGSFGDSANIDVRKVDVQRTFHETGRTDYTSELEKKRLN